jgi:hypothetical protein
MSYPIEVLALMADRLKEFKKILDTEGIDAAEEYVERVTGNYPARKKPHLSVVEDD